MTESDKDATTPTTPSEEEGEPTTTLPPPPLIRRSSPPSNESANSNLSYLFQRYGHHHHKQADQAQQQQQQEEEEAQPLLGQKKATPRYQATKVDDDRRNSIQTLPDLKAIPSSTEEEESAASSSSSSTTTTTTPHAQKPLRRHQQGLLGRVDTFWQTHLRPPTWQSIILRPLACIPSVILGLLLNLLDAISYGKTKHDWV